MGLSSRSKRLKRNRAARRVNYYPKELKKLKDTLTFKWNDKSRTAHLSLFHDLMNGPPPEVPGLEKGSGIERLHLTQTNVSAERNESLLKRRMEIAVDSATKALAKVKKEEKNDEGVKIYDEKSMKDQFGRYAPWLGQKAIKKLIEEEKEGKRKLKLKQRGVARRSASKKQKKKKLISADTVMEVQASQMEVQQID